ncbi:hypothetical protein GV819_27095 [Pseudomonas sp. Fl5BN2]|uniref:pYEATS domain-containing protein n=1 Tax=unclassified Pseudomonas TaxID=196821 RepID=UPI00137822C4|nr:MULTISPECIES: pYEATS domain-containing protein [unclassified Pseudomonas]NBF05966.1 hypothetical protein [Pseudomonas sp. Fl5BN2]NBF10856.1 hypothetical protein [Pseudomonas sp. Fl4BN1]
MKHSLDPLPGSGLLHTAAGMHKNPLGLIALFIVMVYAIGGIVLWTAKDPFYNNPSHPVVLFLALFPVAVLLVFFVLVAKYHTHLYGPGDYSNQEHFVLTGAPKEWKGSTTGIAVNGKPVALDDMPLLDRLNASYAQMLECGFVLLHQSEVLHPRTAPGNGLYKVRVWIEALDSTSPLEEIESVTYRLWNDFPQTVIATSNQPSSFDLWLKIYGEFPIMALIKKRNGDTFELTRHLDLPGRPTD